MSSLTYFYITWVKLYWKTGIYETIHAFKVFLCLFLDCSVSLECPFSFFSYWTIIQSSSNLGEVFICPKNKWILFFVSSLIVSPINIVSLTRLWEFLETILTFLLVNPIIWDQLFGQQFFVLIIIIHIIHIFLFPIWGLKCIKRTKIVFYVSDFVFTCSLKISFSSYSLDLVDFLLFPLAFEHFT